MQGGLRSGLVVGACVMLGFVVSAGPGLVARAAEPERWRERLLPSVAEQASLADAHPGRTAGGPALAAGSSSPLASDEREALLQQNRALAQQNQALLLENRALVEARGRATRSCVPPEGEDAKAQLLYWGERLRSGDYGLRGGLSSTQAAALGVLLRPARPLDRDNPWR